MWQIDESYLLFSGVGVTEWITRKPCYRKETARWRSCSLHLKVRRHLLQI